MKKHNLLMWVLCAALLAGLAGCSGRDDYARILEENWGFSMPEAMGYSECYEKNTETSFQGDGLRYHVFSYENAEPVETLVRWEKTPHKTIFFDSCRAAASMWTDELEVPKEWKPDYEACVFWYQAREDDSELLVFHDPQRKLLYVVESFL